MNFSNPIGQIIDGKYKIERQLGKGGMGTVYLATHIGTERPVAVKVIAPQFMARREFVERFRREARAAGRLRHPNVVDVTDFGIVEENGLAYLVMEYLDGCTLGEILEEEGKLPLGWSIDIIEQVCSAVNAAHEQGIIHRDLKPDNIWLEPNQRGSYTVKVLDFGIAKLEDSQEDEQSEPGLLPSSSGGATLAAAAARETIANEQNDSPTVRLGGGATLITEKSTAIIQPLSPNEPVADADEKSTAIMNAPASSEAGTAILPGNGTQLMNAESEGTRMFEDPSATDDNAEVRMTAELTRAGAVLGTPLYMSPEQCRGERLSTRSDIYALAVITYQMLSGKTPFEGEFTGVMLAHRETPPPPLKVKKLPKKVREVIHAGLSKSSEERPETAIAYASQLRAGSEGIGELLRRSMVIFSEHLPKFTLVAIITLSPWIVLALVRSAIGFLEAFSVIPDTVGLSVLSGALGLVSFFVQIFCAAALAGVITWIVAQHLAVPLRPINLKAAFGKLRERFRSLALPVTLSTLAVMIGFGMCIIPGVWLSARFILVTPVIMMERLSGRAAFRRSAELGKRSYRTVLATAILLHLVPGVLAILVSIGAALIADKFFPNAKKTVVASETVAAEGDAANPAGADRSPENDGGLNISINGRRWTIDDKGPMSPEEAERVRVKKMRETLTGSLIEIGFMPFNLIVFSFASVISALLYFKTRQAGGESMSDLLERFEEDEADKKNWQARVQNRLIQSGRVSTGKTT